MGEGAAADNQTAAGIEGDAADKLTVGNERFDPAVGVAAEDSAAANIAVIQPVLIINTRAFDQPVSSRQRFELHRIASSRINGGLKNAAGCSGREGQGHPGGE